MPKLKIANDQSEYEVEEGEAVIDICDDNDACIPFGCRAGACGTCRVRVLENPEGFLPAEEAESDFLRDFIPDSKPGERLACQCTISGKGDITVQLVDTGQHSDVPNKLKD